MPYYIINSKPNGNPKFETSYLHERSSTAAIDLFLTNTNLKRYEFDILDVEQISDSEYELIKQQRNGTKLLGYLFMSFSFDIFFLLSP